MSSIALAPMWTPPISERAELIQWALYIINQYSKPEVSGSSKHPMYGMRWSPPGRELWLSNILFCTPNIAPVFFYSCSRSSFLFYIYLLRFFLSTTVYSTTLLHLLSLRFHCVGGLNPGLLQRLRWRSDALTIQLDFIRHFIIMLFDSGCKNLWSIYY